MDTARELFFEGVKNVAGKIIGAILFLALLSLFPGLKSLMKRAKNLKAGDLSGDTDNNNFGMKILTVLLIIFLLAGAVWFIPSLRMQVVGYINAHLKRAVDNAETENSKQPETPVTEEVVNDPADAQTQYELGRECYESADYEQAAYWYSKAAVQGYADAQYELASMYAFGPGLEQDNEEAIAWYHKAAEQGHVKAQFTLGFMYQHSKNYSEALKWYQKAAEKGHTQAQFNLGNMYYSGDGVEKDYYEALKWYHKAANQDHPDAEGKIIEIRELMSRL